MTNTSSPSTHAFGAAIDINPEQNPYLQFSEQNEDGSRQLIQVIPPNGWQYITRTKFRKGKPARIGMIDQSIVDIFREQGFIRWGGEWDAPVDYMHFEVYRKVVKLLLTLPKKQASEYFAKYVDFYQHCKKQHPQVYAQGRYSDLHRAIRLHAGQKTLALYQEKGFQQLMQHAEAVRAMPKEKDLCVSLH